MKEGKESAQTALDSTSHDSERDSWPSLEPRECILILREIQHLPASSTRDGEIPPQDTERSPSSTQRT
jgi:hypothetical protein